MNVLLSLKFTLCVGFISGLLCLVVKLFLIGLIFFFHIHMGYIKNQSIEIECIGISAGLGISALYNVLLFILKGKDFFKKVLRPLWSKQYFLSAMSAGCFIQFINLADTQFFWTVPVMPILLLTLEFLFFTFYITIKNEKCSLPPPQPLKNHYNDVEIQKTVTAFQRA